MNTRVSSSLMAPRADTPRADEVARSRPMALHREVLLATDGSPSARAATRVVGAIAARWPVTARAVTVVPPPSLTYDPVGIGGIGATVGARLEEEIAREVRGQLASASLGASIWHHEMKVGSATHEIVRAAEAHASDLIVLGLRPHAFLDRMFRDETALSVMRHASVPVLAATASLTAVPRRIAVAIDFSRASIAAARRALEVLDDSGSLMLVYVEPPSEPTQEETEGYGAIYAQGLIAAFARLRHELAARTSVRIETVVLQGSVVPELLSFAERADVDVIAAGSQRHSIARRAFVGSVTTALARAATRSLFVIPPGRK